MTVTINASTSTGLVQTADTSGIIKVQSNGVTTNALAWVNFAGASGTRNSSYNVSSVTRNAAGDYTLNFANAMSDANYATVATTNQNAAGNTQNFSIGYPDNNSSITYSTTQVRLAVHAGNNAGYFDVPTISVVIFGN
jgi:hypothetical protein